MATEKIGIIGLGLIGGSIAAALGGKYDVRGYDADKSVCDYARAHELCDVVPFSRLSDCDVLFVCVPLHCMRQTLEAVSLLAGDSAIVTDVGSVKLPFANTCGRYVGGHPMAGVERGGIAFAKPNLFKDAYWVITSSGADAQAVKRVVSETGAIPVDMSAEEHDRAVSMYSHAPHAVAYALVNAAVSGGSQPIAGSGFLDMTRIAGSDGGFWNTVFALNRDNVVSDIENIVDELNTIRDMIERNDAELTDYLNGAKMRRDALSRVDLGGETLYVDLIDRVGEFERVTGIVASAGINLTNIALIPGREGAYGALRLEFSSASDKASAANALALGGYTSR